MTRGLKAHGLTEAKGGVWAEAWAFGLDPLGCSSSPRAPLLPEFWEGNEGNQVSGSACRPPLCLRPVWVPTSLPLFLQALRVNGLEQLCNNLASERLQLFSSQMLLAQEEVRGPGPGGGWEHQAFQNRGHP